MASVFDKAVSDFSRLDATNLYFKSSFYMLRFNLQHKATTHYIYQYDSWLVNIEMCLRIR